MFSKGLKVIFVTKARDLTNLQFISSDWQCNWQV